MSSTRRSRGLAAVAGSFALAVTMAACTPPPEENGGSTSGTGGGELEEGCEDYQQFADIAGGASGEVDVYSTIDGVEGESQEASYVQFEECTGIDIVYEASDEFEAQLPVRIQAGSAPDLAMIPQPGLLARIVRDHEGAVQPAADEVESLVDEFFSEDWKAYGTVDGEFYGSPLGANAKSFVWYSPSAFASAGYEVPTTWDDMIALSDQIVADGHTPWCAGIASGDATGWPATDFIEDVVLRTAGPEVYDQWIAHEIPFNDPQILEAVETAGEILKNPEYVNAGLGGIESIATTEWDQAGFPILPAEGEEAGECWMHRAANFYGSNWVNAPNAPADGVEIGEDGDVWAFYLPGSEESKPVLGAGEFTVAFNDEPLTTAVHAYLASDVWANDKAEVSTGWVSANTGLDPELLGSALDRLSYEILSGEEYTFRFDASDLMPGAVGAGSFWTEMVNWIASDKSSEQVLADIEASWPSD